MGKRAVWCLVFLILGLFCAGMSVTEKPLIEEMDNNQLHYYREQHLTHILGSSTQKFNADESDKYFIRSERVLAAVPIINPTTPGVAALTPPPFYLSPILTPPMQPTSTPPPPAFDVNPFPPPMVPTITAPTGGFSGGKSWCVASQSAQQVALQVALDYACGYGGADCSPIQPGGSCYNPNTLKDHASFAFNSYYQKNPVPTSCSFGGTAITTTTDPSSGTCQFPSTSTTSSVPTLPSPPIVPNPPTDLGSTPPTDFGSTPPSVPTDFGSPGVPTVDGSDSEPSGSTLIHVMSFFRCICFISMSYFAGSIVGL